MKRIMLEADEDEYSRKERSRLKSRKKIAKRTERKLETEEEDDDALPLACCICREPFLDPVVTKCHHYFCHHCALKHHAKNIECFVCNQPTMGIFNTAMEIIENIAEEREKARVMVVEVTQMLEMASLKLESLKLETARSMAARAGELVDEVESLVDTAAVIAEKAAVIAEKAEDMAVDVGEMVSEANATMEKARAEMVKAFVVMKSVKWTD